jgi:hypothetical protein
VWRRRKRGSSTRQTQHVGIYEPDER